MGRKAIYNDRGRLMGYIYLSQGVIIDSSACVGYSSSELESYAKNVLCFN